MCCGVRHGLHWKANHTPRSGESLVAVSLPFLVLCWLMELSLALRQVEITQRCFSPPQEAIDKAQRIVDAHHAHQGMRLYFNIYTRANLFNTSTYAREGQFDYSNLAREVHPSAAVQNRRYPHVHLPVYLSYLHRRKMHPWFPSGRAQVLFVI